MVLSMKRVSAFALVLLIAATTVGAEWWECAGWSSSALARHACCAAKIQNIAPDTSANCCAMSQQSRDTGATQARVVVPEPLMLVLAAILTPAAVPGWLAERGRVDVSQPHDSLVPLYVQ